MRMPVSSPGRSRSFRLPATIVSMTSSGTNGRRSPCSSPVPDIATRRTPCSSFRARCPPS
jgi:hypothetical protein